MSIYLAMSNNDAGNELAEGGDVSVYEPLSGDTVSSPLIVSGEARGTWFFEASFSVKLLDSSSTEIATGIAQTSSDWMTTDFVPFSAMLDFPPQPSGSSGTLVLMKDNPSGELAYDDSYSVPISF